MRGTSKTDEKRHAAAQAQSACQLLTNAVDKRIIFSLGGKPSGQSYLVPGVLSPRPAPSPEKGVLLQTLLLFRSSQAPKRARPNCSLSGRALHSEKPPKQQIGLLGTITQSGNPASVAGNDSQGTINTA